MKIKSLSNREKIIFSFLLILIVVNLLTVVITHSLGSFSTSFRSMLDDRLVPSSDISKIQERFYQNRLKIEELIFMVDSSRSGQEKDIRQNNAEIDRILKKYLLTHLTEEEEYNLTIFREELKNYRRIELKIMAAFEAGEVEDAREIFLSNSLMAFNKMLDLLHHLADIQLEVGEELYHNAVNNIRVINLTSYLSIAVAVLLTLNMLKVLDIKMNR